MRQVAGAKLLNNTLEKIAADGEDEPEQTDVRASECAGTESAQLWLGLVDSRSLTRESFSRLLTAAFYPLRVWPTCSVEELVASDNAKLLGVRAVLLSIGAATVATESVDAAIDLVNECIPHASVILLSDHCSANNIEMAVRRGVRGYVLTHETPEIVVEGVRLVLAGGSYFPVGVLISAKPAHTEIASAVGTEEKACEADVPDCGTASLTPRQREVAKVLQEGKPNKIIAYELGMQESTVKVHVRQIMKKLNVTNRTQAALLARRLLDS